MTDFAIVLDHHEMNLRIARTAGADFTIDHITRNGEDCFDHDHLQGGRQTWIGAHMNGLQNSGIIVWTGERAPSRNKFRHSGGTVQVWRLSAKGLLWAKELLENERDSTPTRRRRRMITSR